MAEDRIQPRNSYEILDAAYDHNGSLNAVPRDTYELFRAVAEVDNSGNARLRINIEGGSTGDGTLSGLTDVTITSVTNGQLLGWNGSEWVNVSPGATSAFPLQDLTDATITSLTNGEIIQWDGTAWVNVDADTLLTDYYTKTEVDNSFLSATTEITNETWVTNNFLSASTEITNETWVTNNMLSADTALEDLSDVTINTIAETQTLIYEGGEWINKNNQLSILSDTTITTPQALDILQYDGSVWVNAVIDANSFDAYTKQESDNNFLSATTYIPTNLPDLDDVTLASLTNGNSLVYNGSVWVNETLIYQLNNLSDTNINSLSDNDILIWDSATSKWVNGVNTNTTTLVALTDTDIISPTTNQVLTWNGTKWVNQDNTNTTTLADLTDTNINTPSVNEWLRYSGTEWINSQIQLTNIQDVSLNSPSSNEVLTFNGSEWVNSAATSSVGASEQWVTDNFLSASTNLYSTLDSLTDTVLTSPVLNQALVFDGTDWVNSAITSTGSITADNGLTIVSDVVKLGGSLIEDTILDITNYNLSISGLSAQTNFDDDSISYVVNDAGETITGTTNIENYSVGVQDDSNYNLSYLDINLSSGITLSSNNANAASSGDTSYMKISSDGFDTTMIIDELANVNLSSEISGEALVYDGSEWVNSAVTTDMSNYYTSGECDANFLSASTTFSSTLSGLTDVTISSVSDGQLISYNSATTAWENIDSTIIDVVNPLSGDTLIYNDGTWVNSTSYVDSKIILRSPDGTKYYVGVDNSGIIVTTAV